MKPLRMVIRFIIPTVFALVFCSCSRLIHNKYQGTRFKTDSTLSLVRVFKTDSSRVYFENNSGKYFLKRGQSPTLLQFKHRDTLLEYYLVSELSPAYKYGNLAGFPFSYVIDAQFPRRFRYNPYNYFSYDSKEQKIMYSPVRPVEEHELRLSLGWSFINGYHPSLFGFYPSGGAVTPLGINGQAEYFPKVYRSWMAELGVSSTVVPKRINVPRGKDSIEEYYSTNLWLLLNHKWHYKKWSAGGGVSIAPTQNTKTTFYVSHRDTVYSGTIDTVTYHYISEPKYFDEGLIKLGLNFNLSYIINNIASLGFNWHVYVSDVNRNRFYSSHFFNLYLGFRIHQFNLNRKPRKQWK